MTTDHVMHGKQHKQPHTRSGTFITFDSLPPPRDATTILGTCMLGTCMLGTCVRGTCVLGTCVLGTCVLGTCVLGTCVLGTCASVAAATTTLDMAGTTNVML